MKKLFNQLIVSLIVFVFPIAAFASDPNLVAYWCLDGDATDSSGNSHHGAPYGDPTWIVEGKIDGAIQLDGEDDHIGTPFILDPNNVFSALAWVRLDTKSTDYQVIVQQEGEDPNHPGRVWLGRNADDSLFSYIGGGFTSSTNPVFSTPGQWTHVGVTYDGSTVTLYANGQWVGSSSKAAESCSGSMLIGTHKSKDPLHFWDGLIDDVQIYDRALDQSEIADIVGPVLNVSSNTFVFSSTDSLTNPADQILTIENKLGGTLNWVLDMTGKPDWLTITPTNGSLGYEGSEPVTLSVNITGLSDGQYSYAFDISDPNAINSPQAIAVYLNVGAISVPGDYATIQGAIDAAVNGDTIIVSPGTYEESIILNSKSITLRSLNPNDVMIVSSTIIEPPHGERGVVIEGGPASECVFTGFTITKGTILSGKGAGIAILHSSPTISHCDFFQMFINGDDGYDTNGGAGIYVYNGSPLIEYCNIELMETMADGYVSDLGYEQYACNFAPTLGGSILLESSSAIVRYCTIQNSYIGIGTSGGCTDPYDYEFFAEQRGAGIATLNGSDIIENCLIFDCYAMDNREGGGIYTENFTGSIKNCTVVNNYPDGISSDGGNLSNTIIWGNYETQLVGGVIPQYSAIQDWAGGGIGNISSDPLFADTASGDYYLRSQYGRWDEQNTQWVFDTVTSPCIDAGDPASDWTDELWPHGERINMGAFGGMPQASMSSDPFGLLSDLNHDECVSLDDLILFCNDWMKTIPLLDTDLNRDGKVDLEDFALLSQQWAFDDLAVLSISNTHFIFMGLEAGPDPNSEILTITNLGGSTLNWAIESELLSDWLNINPISGSLDSDLSEEINIAVDLSDLSSGHYEDSFSIVDPNAINGSETVTVELDVMGSALHVSQTMFSMTVFEGDDNPSPEILTVSNLGGGEMDWSIDTADFPGWLSITPTEGSLGYNEYEDLLISIDISGLGEGEYAHSFDLVNSDDLDNPETVTVELEILGPDLYVSNIQFTFLATEGAEDPNVQTLTVSNVGGGMLNWSLDLTDKPDWFSITPISGTLGRDEFQLLTLSIDITELQSGSYDYIFEVYDNMAQNSPQDIEVLCDIYPPGSGTPEDPYQITNVEQLAYIGSIPEFYSKSFVLLDDVDCDGHPFYGAVIASDTIDDSTFYGTEFTGVFDGNGYRIINLTINPGVSNSFLGLFGNIGLSGEVKDLELENCNVLGPSSGSAYIGAIAGQNTGEITDCFSSGQVRGGCCVGGLVGRNYYGTITNSGSHSNIIQSGLEIGGLVGSNILGTVSRCYAKGNIEGWFSLGGLTGVNSGMISDCYATGMVSGEDEIGGFIGRAGSSSITENCYSAGNVSEGFSYVGGFIGNNASGTIESCYFLDTTGPDNGYGSPLIDVEMKQQASFVDWDFILIWEINEGASYPYLWWE